MVVSGMTPGEAALEPKRHQFTVGDYYRMAEAGILAEDERVELIEGEILQMSPIGPKHAGCVRRLRRVFEGLGQRAVVGVQDPIRVSDYAEPQPDLMLLRYRADSYASSHPIPDDVLLVVDVADTSVEYDRQVKVPLYARGGIPEIWLVDLPSDHVVVYRDPTGDGYATTHVARRGETLSPVALPELANSADDILG